jgi:hypothetical protein
MEGLAAETNTVSETVIALGAHLGATAIAFITEFLKMTSPLTGSYIFDFIVGLEESSVK